MLTAKASADDVGLMSCWSAVKAPSSNQAQANILVTRFKCIGDIIFALPAVHALREHFPAARITVLTSRENGPLFEGFGCVDRIITVDRAAYHRGRLGTITREIFSLLRTFRREKFSLAIDFQGYGETAILTWLTRAPERWGCVYRRARGLAYTRRICRDPALHPVDWNLSMLKQCGVATKSVRNEFILPASALEEARKVWTRLKLDPEKPAMFIQPFTSTPRKNWPLQNYLALANHWRALGVQVVFGGGPQERTALEPADCAGFAVSAGTPILVSAGLVKLSTIIVGGDTGLLHMAVAMKKRVVCLAPASRPYPYPHPDWKIVPPSDSDMLGITLHAAVEACTQAFAEQHCLEPLFA